MGQVCPASTPSQQYVPTNCQGVSTSTTYVKRKIETNQPCVESRLISRGASCTQDDIRRSLRKEKELQKTSLRSSNISEGNKDDECLHPRHRHSSRSIQNPSIERHRPDGQDSLRNKEHREKDRKGKKHRHHKHGHDDALQVIRDEFEQFEHTHHHEAQRNHQYHKTHLLHQKGAVLHVESHVVAKQEVSTRQQNKHDPQHHQHDKVVRQENEFKIAEVNRKERDKFRHSPHVAYSSQNEHNAKISARKNHLPNNSQSIRSSEKLQKEWSNRMEADSSRSSMKTKQKEKSARGSQRTRKLEDPVYSLPPIIK
nr:corepressor interacting with RBPJ 1-like isoform X1 [Lytechinus pictus]